MNLFVSQFSFVVELCNHLCSKNITGSIDSMDALNKEYASCGEEGITTLNPEFRQRVIASFVSELALAPSSTNYHSYNNRTRNLPSKHISCF